MPHIWVAGKTNQHLGWGVRLGSLAYTPPLQSAETRIGHPGYIGASDGDEAQKEAWSQSQCDRHLALLRAGGPHWVGHLPHIWVAGKTNQHLGWGVRLGSLAYTPPLPGAETGIGHPGYIGASDGDEAQKEAWSQSQCDRHLALLRAGAETGIGHPGYIGASDGDEAQKEAWSQSQCDRHWRS